LGLVRQLGGGSLVAQFCGILTYSALAYLGARRYAFAGPQRRPATPRSRETEPW
jgi:hypothetical protein